MRIIATLMLMIWGSLLAHGQTDSLPRIVEGKFDWKAYKREVGAPAFNQKDLVMYVVRMEGLAPLFNDERDKEWINEFHFIDINGDDFLDAIYSGDLRSQGGEYSIILLGDSVLSLPLAYSGPGHLVTFEPDEGGITFVNRREGKVLKDAQGSKEYLTEISLNRFDYETMDYTAYWRVEYPYLCEVPPQTHRKSVVLQEPTQIRWQPRIPSAKVPVDLDGDGEMDAEAALSGVLDKGSRLLCTARFENEKKEIWTFCLSIDPPRKGHVYSLLHKVGKSYAGWVRGDFLAP